MILHCASSQLHIGFGVVQAQDLRDDFLCLVGISIEKSVDSLLLLASNVVAGRTVLFLLG